MSIFNKDLICGELGDVIRIYNIMYPSGSSIYSTQKVCEAMDMDKLYLRSVNYDSPFHVDYPELDHESEWLLFYDGFNCNIGDIWYEHIFKQFFVEDIRHEYIKNPGIHLITEAALKGKFETMWKPWDSSWNKIVEDVDPNRIEYHNYWERVGDTMISGIKEYLSDNIRAFVTSRIVKCDLSRCSYLVNITFISKDDQHLNWPTSNCSYMMHRLPVDDIFNSHFVINPDYDSNPVKISLLVESEYFTPNKKGYSD